MDKTRYHGSIMGHNFVCVFCVYVCVSVCMYMYVCTNVCVCVCEGGGGEQ